MLMIALLGKKNLGCGMYQQYLPSLPVPSLKATCKRSVAASRAKDLFVRRRCGLRIIRYHHRYKNGKVQYTRNGMAVMNFKF